MKDSSIHMKRIRPPAEQRTRTRAPDVSPRKFWHRINRRCPCRSKLTRVAGETRLRGAAGAAQVLGYGGGAGGQEHGLPGKGAQACAGGTHTLTHHFLDIPVSCPHAPSTLLPTSLPCTRQAPSALPEGRAAEVPGAPGTRTGAALSRVPSPDGREREDEACAPGMEGFCGRTGSEVDRTGTQGKESTTQKGKVPLDVTGFEDAYSASPGRHYPITLSVRSSSVSNNSEESPTMLSNNRKARVCYAAVFPAMPADRVNYTRRVTSPVFSFTPKQEGTGPQG